MEPAVPDGVFVGIDVSYKAPIEGRIYALRVDGGAVLRRLFFEKKDVWVFYPDNPAPGNRFYSFARPKETPIIGKVCFVFHSLQRKGEY